MAIDLEEVVQEAIDPGATDRAEIISISAIIIISISTQVEIPWSE
jgi:hypothetical protein